MFSPYLLTLEQGGLPARMREFVKNGGTWVVGPQSDMRDGFGGKYAKSYTGMLEDFCGVSFDDYVIDAKGLLSMAWQDGAPYENAGVYQDVLTASEPLARITGGNRALMGKAVAARAKVGRGTVIVLGGLPGRDGLDRIIKMVCPHRFCHTPNVLAAARSGKRHGLLVGEFDGKPGSLTLDEPMRDLLTGKEFRGEISLNPYDFLVLEKK